MKNAEVIAKMENIKTHPRVAPESRELATAVIQLSNLVAELRYKVAKLEGKPMPPDSF